MKLSLITVAASVVSIVNALAAPAAQVPDSKQVTIRGIEYNGSGCKKDTAQVVLADDRKSFTVIFDNYIASAGPKYNAGPKDRKNCQLNVDFHLPQGWQYSIYSADFRGYVDLDKYVKATQAAHYYFTGVPGTASTQSDIWGKVQENYEVYDAVGASAIVWSPCGTDVAVNINSEVRVDATKRKGTSGTITVDSIDGKVQFVCGIQWRRCK